MIYGLTCRTSGPYVVIIWGWRWFHSRVQNSRSSDRPRRPDLRQDDQIRSLWLSVRQPECDKQHRRNGRDSYHAVLNPAVPRGMTAVTLIYAVKDIIHSPIVKTYLKSSVPVISNTYLVLLDTSWKDHFNDTKNIHTWLTYGYINSCHLLEKNDLVPFLKFSNIQVLQVTSACPFCHGSLTYLIVLILFTLVINDHILMYMYLK
jgi:hypothetical protein